MAIAPTGAIYKALTFDGTSSRTYGVYITGEAVYNAPQRDVEMISIPGRNGAYALDKGRFENIEVTYPAGIFADTETDFADAISDFRNFLCSRDGYVRLTDEYNPSEYRMAVYKSGLEVTPAMLKAGQFNITFECKPQRWLTSGETEVAVTSGDTITNPTLHDSQPLLAVKGEGNITIGKGTISLVSQDTGTISLFGARSATGTGQIIAFNRSDNTFSDSLLNTHDEITVDGAEFVLYFSPKMWKFSESGSGVTGVSSNGGGVYVNYTFPKLTMSYRSTGDYPQTYTYTSSLKLYTNTSTYYTYTVALTLSNRFSNGGQVYMYATVTPPSSTPFTLTSWSLRMEAVTAYSTVSTLGNPTYLDCEIGDAYAIVNDEYISKNSMVSFVGDLPVLEPGANTITFDNTVTELKIAPRWWKL